MFLTMFCRKKRSLIGMKSLPRNDRQPPEYGSESGPESDNEPIYFTPNQQRIIRAGAAPTEWLRKYSGGLTPATGVEIQSRLGVMLRGGFAM
jgi:hypothetical protein